MTSPEAEPLGFRSGFGGELGSKLYKAALEGEGTDVEISFGDTTIKKVHAHANVLQIESEVFKVMLGERWKTEKKPEDGKTLIDLPEDKYSDFVLFMKFLYGFQDLKVSNFNKVLPAYKLVDKYRVDSVLKLCDEYFRFLIDNMEKVDAAKLLWMAKDHQIDVLYKAAMAYVKTNLHSIWIHNFLQIPHPYQSWMDWDEETWIEIISTDELKVLPHKQQGTFDWSRNEYEIAFFTHVWLHCGRSTNSEDVDTDGEPPAYKESREVDFDSSARVISKIRFMQMSNDHFLQFVQMLVGRISKGHIADITVAYARGMDTEYYTKEIDFEVDTRLRKL